MDNETLTNDPGDLESSGPSAAASVSSNHHPSNGRAAAIVYILVPFLFLAVTLFGGLRINGSDNTLVFLKPALTCLIFALMAMILFARAGLVEFGDWFSDRRPVLTIIANAAVLATLFAATAQVFNSLIPERGLPFWIVAFCFLWTLWNNIFAEFDTKRLFRSIGGLFALAFVAKYMVLAGLTAPAGKSWISSFIENPAQEAVTILFDLPRYAAATGYIQFFCLLVYLLGLFFLPRTMNRETQ